MAALQWPHRAGHIAPAARQTFTKVFGKRFADEFGEVEAGEGERGHSGTLNGAAGSASTTVRPQRAQLCCAPSEDEPAEAGSHTSVHEPRHNIAIGP